MNIRKYWFVLLLLPLFCFSQKMYLVSVGGTKGKVNLYGESSDSYNKTTLVSLNLLDKRIQEIASTIGYSYELVQVSDDGFNKEVLKQKVRDLKVAPYDIIIFTILAHGYNERKLSSAIVGGNVSTFPTTLISYNNNVKEHIWERDYLPFESFVKDMYMQKKPRLLIALVDACNEEGNLLSGEMAEKYSVNDRLLEVNPEKYIINGLSESKGKQMLLSRTGIVLISSTSVGQKAFGSPQTGSNYTVKFCNTVRDMLSEDNALTFESLVSRLSDNIVASSSKSKFLSSDRTQRPQVFNFTKPITLPQITNQATPVSNSPTQDDGTSYISQGRKLILMGYWEQARSVFMSGLNKFPNNEDLKMAVFITEVNLGYKKFTTISFDNLRERIERNPTNFEAQGFAYLQYLVGISYLTGENGFSADVKKATHWFILSFDNGNRKPSCRMLTKLGLTKCMDLL